MGDVAPGSQPSREIDVRAMATRPLVLHPSASADSDDEQEDIRASLQRRRAESLRRLVGCGCLFALSVLGVLAGAATLLARFMRSSSTLQSLDDQLSYVGARWRHGRTAPSSHTLIGAPPGAIVLLTGELRFRDEAAAAALRARLANVTVLVCTWRRFGRVAARLAPAGVLLLDEPTRAIPHGAADQFYLLQRGVREFRSRLLAASVVARLRTDAHYAESFAIPALSASTASADGHDLVLMETDLAFAAAPSTFVRVYSSVYDSMAARGYYKHREQGRAMPPNFAHVARSDASSSDRRGWRTRWRWLEYPTAVYAPGVHYSAEEIVALAGQKLAQLTALSLRAPNITVRHLTTAPPVPHFCAESAFLHHTLETAAVAPLAGVTLTPRDQRCPDGGRRRPLRDCTGWLM